MPLTWAPNDWVTGDAITPTRLNNIGNSIRTWQGTVNANGNNLANVATLSVAEINSGNPILIRQDYAGIAEVLKVINGSGTASSREAGLMLARSPVHPMAGLVGSNDIDGSFGSGYLRILTRYGDALAERMRITAAGFVGIGTATPAARLDVAGDLYLSGGGATKAKWFHDAGTATTYFTTEGSSRIAFAAGGLTPLIIKSSSRINLTPATTYDTDGAAGTGGLASGDVFWDSNGFLRRKA